MSKSIELKARQTLLTAMENLWVYATNEAIKDGLIEEKDRGKFEAALKADLKDAGSGLKAWSLEESLSVYSNNE